MMPANGKTTKPDLCRQPADSNQVQGCATAAERSEFTNGTPASTYKSARQSHLLVRRKQRVESTEASDHSQLPEPHTQPQ